VVNLSHSSIPLAVYGEQVLLQAGEEKKFRKE
jgi:hypothetical protein